ncbi:MAG: VWA domain-containing protein [Spirochaetota bacterium]|nr:VWA domain-containing protein [Spirochaetota bacterium]
MKQKLLLFSAFLFILINLIFLSCGTEKSGYYPSKQPLIGDNKNQQPVSEKEKSDEDEDRADFMISKKTKYKKMHEANDFKLEDRQIPFELKDREKYQYYGENPRVSPIVNPVSTFSVDVDTGSYTNTRRYIQKMGKLPPKDSIRVEEFINYFEYKYPLPDGEIPFSINHELAKSPFDPDRLLLHIGLQGIKIPFEQRPNSNLVFLIDVSGSMSSPNKLDLLKSALIMLTNQMTKRDNVSIVVYAGAAGVVLYPTSGSNKKKIKNALRKLNAGGSTAGGEGIILAYKMAEKAFIKGGINRVILASDGDFNVGITNHSELIKLIEEKRKSGIALTVLGFGMYNLNDKTMEQLANKGNGNYFYIDNLNEARKVLVTELGSTLQIIAKDVKIQIEFNPKYVSSYRLIGYENRKLKRKDFDNDKIDAGEIGAGHTVTAIYELTMTDSAKAKSDLRYSKEQKEIEGNIKKTDTKFSDEIAFFRLRYKKPNADNSILYETPLRRSVISTDNTSDNFRFSAAVAHFAQKLRKSEYNTDISYDKILRVMRSSRGEDNWGYRKECENLVELAKSLSD